MNKKTVSFLVAICGLLLAGCNQQQEERVESLTECMDIVIPEEYMITGVQEVEATNQMFVHGYNPNATEILEAYQWFQLKETEEGYSDAQAIEIPSTYLVQNAVVSKDGAKMYFSAYTSEDWNIQEHPEIFSSLKIYEGSLEKGALKNITELENVNLEDINVLADIDEQNNLYYASSSIEDIEEQDVKAYCAKKTEQGYETKKLELSEDVKNSGIAKVLDKEKEIIMATYDEQNYLDEFYQVSHDEERITETEKLYLPQELVEAGIIYYSLSANDNMLYFVTYSEGKGSKVYKISWECFLEQQEEWKTKEETKEYEPCSYDAYDTSDFDMKYRNKGDRKEKQGVYYEIFVRSFADSDGDGVGDFNGVTAKLNYLKDLGIEGIWLMPIHASPSYHGYDVTDYNSVNAEYGTEQDFEKLIKEAHKRDIKVIMDFVINHTSSEHPWFQNAIEDENSEYRNYYRWVKKSDTKDYDSADVSNWGDTVWHKNGTDYYYGIFSADMPDLNYNNVKVREEIINSAKKWLELGVDGFRLDAAMHIYGVNEFKQQQDSLQANMQWWNEFALACEEVNPDVYLVGEAWQETETLAEYAQPFDTKFNFTFQSDLITAIQQGNAQSATTGVSLAELIENLLKEYQKVDENFIDGVFAGNHDQNRVCSQLETEEQAKLAASIYLTLPGNPFIYYGEELGMLGEKPDEYIREPLKWSEDGSDMDTTWEESTYNKELISAKEQQKTDTDSMYQHYKQLIALRKQNKALCYGNYQAVDVGQEEMMVYVREADGEKLLVLHNLSGKAVVVEHKLLAKGKVIFGKENQKKTGEESMELESYATIVVSIK